MRHFIQLNDDLVAEHGSTRFALTISEPPTTGSKRWDAALAALAAYRLADEQLPSPGWVTDPSRRLGKSWTFGSGRYAAWTGMAVGPAMLLVWLTGFILSGVVQRQLLTVLRYMTWTWMERYPASRVEPRRANMAMHTCSIR